MPSTFRAGVLTAALAATAAHASGFYFGDNGSKALMQGGAFTGQADDLTAIMYNPAGLARMDGINFLVDAQLLNHETSFTRLDPGFDVNNPPASLANTVTNQGGLFFLPFLGVSYAFEIPHHRLTLALGLYGPPSVGRYNYPQPNYTVNSAGRYVEPPRKYAPSRYALINNDIIILYPTLSAALQVHRRFQLGISLQLIYSTFSFRQALSSQQDLGLAQPTKQTEEDPQFDSTVNVDLKGNMIQHGLLSFTGIAGAMFQPLDNLSIGASVRPPIPIRASGTLKIDLQGATSAAKVVGDQADLFLTLPLEARVGVHFKPIERLGLNADFVYLGWQSVDELLLTPKDVTLQVGTGEAKPVAQFHIPKKWHESVSVRLGASFDLIKYLTLHAGFLYETGAVPAQYTGIDFLHFDRAFITGGVTAHLWQFDVLAGIAVTPTVNQAINDSEARQGITSPDLQGSVIGDGLYGSGGWILTFGIRGHFGGPAPAAAPPPAEAPAPAPAPSTPAPAAT